MFSNAFSSEYERGHAIQCFLQNCWKYKYSFLNWLIQSKIVLMNIIQKYSFTKVPWNDDHYQINVIYSSAFNRSKFEKKTYWILYLNKIIYGKITTKMHVTSYNHKRKMKSTCRSKHIVFINMISIIATINKHAPTFKLWINVNGM